MQWLLGSSRSGKSENGRMRHKAFRMYGRNDGCLPGPEGGKKFQKTIKENPHYLSMNFGGLKKDSGGLTEYGISIYETVSEIQPLAVH